MTGGVAEASPVLSSRFLLESKVLEKPKASEEPPAAGFVCVKRHKEYRVGSSDPIPEPHRAGVPSCPQVAAPQQAPSVVVSLKRPSLRPAVLCTWQHGHPIPGLTII